MGKNSVFNKINEKLSTKNIENRISENRTNKSISSTLQKSNTNILEVKEENKKKVDNHKKLNNGRTKYQFEYNEQKYVIKIIYFVAIQVAVDEAPAPAKRARSKVVDEKPPCPVH